METITKINVITLLNQINLFFENLKIHHSVNSFNISRLMNISYITLMSVDCNGDKIQVCGKISITKYLRKHDM